MKKPYSNSTTMEFILLTENGLTPNGEGAAPSDRACYLQGKCRVESATAVRE